jgi:putative NIF3 family GTP cyclohydrolase 1 type 2
MQLTSQSRNNALTVGDVVSKLRTADSLAWQDASWDGLQAGNANAQVTGIAVAWSPGISVLRKAAEQGCNLLLVKDPLYWSEEAPGLGTDRPPTRITEGSAGGTPWSAVEATSLYRYKKDLIERSRLNVVRVAQNWDGLRANALLGLLKALNWKEGESFIADEFAPNSRTSVVKIAPQTLIQLAEYAKAHLGAKSVRVLGDRDAKVSTVAIHPAYITVKAATRLGMVPNLDAVLSGEGCEWESFEYFEDWIDAGRGKGLIMLGLAVTSDTAAKEFSDWVHSVVNPTRVVYLPVGDPFTPAHAGALRV